MTRPRRAVLVVCDSLRADLIRPETAPTLAALGATGCRFTNFRPVFPSVTRVSSASIATGCRPRRHGLLGNTMVLDEGAGLVCLSAGRPDFRDRMRQATGRTLRCPTLAERLAGQGGSVVMSNVSPGAAYFQDPDGFGHVYHRAGSFGPGPRPVPDADHLDIEIGIQGDARMTARFCSEVLESRQPALAVLWLSEPDHTGHRTPLGSPAHLEAIASADRCVARVLDTLARQGGRGEATLLVVCSDHGMETTGRTIALDRLLVDAGLKQSPSSPDVVVAPNGTAAVIYRAREARATVEDLQRFLGMQDWAGQVFAGRELGRVGLPADETVALAVTLRAEDRLNPFGVPGVSDIVADPAEPKDYTGFGQHGGLGPNEQRPFLFMLGGGFPPATRVDAPASHVDLAPTILRHLGLDARGLDGRPLDPCEVRG